MTLFHDAQEIAILNGKEEITIETLNDAYNSRMQFMEQYIQPVVKKASAKKQAQNRTVTVQTHNEVKEVSMKDLLKKVPSRYELVNVVACRARKIASEEEM